MAGTHRKEAKEELHKINKEIAKDIRKVKDKLHIHSHQDVNDAPPKVSRQLPKKDTIGNLYITIGKGKKLKFPHAGVVREHDFKGCAGCVQSCTRIMTCDMCACGRPDACCGKADPFITVDIIEAKDQDPARLFKTQTVNNNHDPEWGMTRCIPLLIEQSKYRGNYPCLRLTLRDDDFSADDTFSDTMGFVDIPLWKALHYAKMESSAFDYEFQAGLVNSKKKAGKVSVSFQYDSISTKSHEVEACHTAAAQRSSVDFYQDAHQHGLLHPSLPAPRGCWNDLEKSLLDANKFIFCCGWSVNHETRLNRKSEMTVGELLINRANAGVKVFLLLWADMSSDMLTGGGMMGTSDVKTCDYFKNTKVQCVRVSRDSANNVGMAAVYSKGIYTHHQKTVIMDARTSSGLKTLVAYVGGLDITDGRFDTCDHQMFKTLGNEHKDDFYNGCLPKATLESGPREPWHDIHCRVFGNGAWAVLANFLDRAKIQASFYTALKRVVDDIKRNKDFNQSTNQGDYSTQVLRSIDTAVATFGRSPFRDQFADISNVVENSIHTAYVQNIMGAKRFIYIENQYFLGSAPDWLEKKGVRCVNNVPRAIVQKIKQMISTHKDFCAYILMPLFPEGDPASAPSQEIIHWQYQTMRSMYSQITAHLRNHGSSKCAEDYLKIFFAGKKEPEVDTSSRVAIADTAGAKYVTKALSSKRHMIYIHSKMLLVDDEYLLIGSANINDRSMAGDRDTEIALAAWSKSAKTETNDFGEAVTPRGQIRDFRLNLWAEHLNTYENVFDDPGSMACRNTITAMTKNNWNAYASKTMNPMPHGKLCSYPFEIDVTTGEIDTYPGCSTFPDTDAPIKGTHKSAIMELLTT